MLVTEITNHVDAALARFMQQYQSIPAIYTMDLPITDETIQVSALLGIMAALIDQCQGIENSGFDVNSGRQLWNGTSTPAYGQQLDNLGTLINLPRNGLSDAEYLVFIFGTIGENNSDTTITAVTDIVSILFQESSFLSFEMYPAEMDFEIPTTTPLPTNLYLVVANIIQNSIGAGIGLGFIATYPNPPLQCAYFAPALVTSGDTVTGSKLIHNLASTTNLAIGQTVAGAGFPLNTLVTAISGSTATVSNESTQTLTAVGLAFGGQVIGSGFGDLNDLSAGGFLATLIYNGVSFSGFANIRLTTESGSILTTEAGDPLIL